jgi:hypothetical protein
VYPHAQCSTFAQFIPIQILCKNWVDPTLYSIWSCGQFDKNLANFSENAHSI